MLERTGESVRVSHAPDDRLAEALRPALTAALKTTIQDEPRMWAEALFPAMLPAVRLAVSSALRGMVRTLNQVLDESLSLRSWKWRLEAWRTGRTLAEVVLLRTLVYRVEQVLLVDRRAGLVLASVAAEDVVPRDSTSISAMLVALQDFVSDTFEVNAEAGIREFHLGDFSVLVETGPRAAIAAAVRGAAPADLRETLRAAIDLVHQEFASELRDFRDDSQPFERTTTILEGCLQARYAYRETYSYTKLWLTAGIILVALVSWIGLRVAEARRWDRAVEVLRNAHGIAVTQSDRRHHLLEGLYDPLAIPPEVLLSNSGIERGKVLLRFHPYISLDRELVVKRARMILNAPDSVSVSLDDGVLKAAGAASHSWILQARTAGPKLDFLGVRGIELGALTDREMESLRAELESGAVLFDVTSSLLTEEQLRAGKILATMSRQWVEYASGIGRSPRLLVLGYADPAGNNETNVALSRRRAERLAKLLMQAGISPGLLSIEGRGRSPDAAADFATQRRALVRTAPGETTRSAP